LSPSISPVNLNLELGASTKKEINIVRYESDKLKICESKEIRTKRYFGLFGEKTWIVHLLDKKGRVSVKRLN
jgi:hypothetical protein